MEFGMASGMASGTRNGTRSGRGNGRASGTFDAWQAADAFCEKKDFKIKKFHVSWDNYDFTSIIEAWSEEEACGTTGDFFIEDDEDEDIELAHDLPCPDRAVEIKGGHYDH